MIFILSTLVIGFTVFFGQILTTELLILKRQWAKEIDEALGTCDKIYPPYRHSSQPLDSLALEKPRKKHLSRTNNQTSLTVHTKLQDYKHPNTAP